MLSLKMREKPSTRSNLRLGSCCSTTVNSMVSTKISGMWPSTAKRRETVNPNFYSRRKWSSESIFWIEMLSLMWIRWIRPFKTKPIPNISNNLFKFRTRSKSSRRTTTCRWMGTTMIIRRSRSPSPKMIRMWTSEPPWKSKLLYLQTLHHGNLW